MSYISNPLYGQIGTLYPTLENTPSGLENDGTFDNTGIITADNIYPQAVSTTFLNCSITTDADGYIQLVQDGGVGDTFTSGAYAIPTVIPSGGTESISNNLVLDEGFYAITQEIVFKPNTNATTSVLQVLSTLSVFEGATFIKNYFSTLILNATGGGSYPVAEGLYTISSFLNVPVNDTYTLNTEMFFSGGGSNPSGSAVITAFRLSG